MSTDVQTTIGILTFGNAAAALPVTPERQTMALQRLIARSAITTLENPTLGTVITVEAMKDFFTNGAANRAMREHLNMPPETLLPIFVSDESDANWFDLRYVSHLVDSFQVSIVALIQQQMPPSIKELADAARFRSPDYDAVKTLEPGNVSIAAQVDPRFDPKIAPQIVSLIRQPIDLRQLTIPKARRQAIPFKNLGELVLVANLQYFAIDIIKRRASAALSPSAIRMSDSLVSYEGIDALYASVAQYAEIVVEAQKAMQNTIGLAYASMQIPEVAPSVIAQNQPTWPENTSFTSQSYRRYERFVSHEMILNIAETSYPRLIALAF